MSGFVVDLFTVLDHMLLRLSMKNIMFGSKINIEIFLQSNATLAEQAYN